MPLNRLLGWRLDSRTTTNQLMDIMAWDHLICDPLVNAYDGTQDAISNLMEKAIEIRQAAQEVAADLEELVNKNYFMD